MLMLSIEGWLAGLTITGVIIARLIFGSFLIHTAKNTHARLLSYVGISSIVAGFVYLVGVSDFFVILLTDKNANFSSYFLFFLSGMWSPIAGIFSLYIATELLIPKKKWYVISVFLFLVVLLYTFLLFDPLGSYKSISPTKPGENLIESSLIMGSTASIIVLLLSLFTIVFNVCGLLIKGFKSTGVIRKKLICLSIGYSLGLMFIILESFAPPEYSFFPKIGLLSLVWLYYYGLREEPEKPKKVRTKKEITVEDSLFRISKRPDHLTEEEVSISKEKKICLVCKGKIGGINFVCIECGTFYCMKCTEVLRNSENMCWACNSPIDPSKPMKPYKKEEIELGFELSEGVPKK